MSITVTCDQRRDFLLLYVSDALDAPEAAEMRRHLQSGCPACAGYLAESQALMTSLPLGLDRITPPPGLKARLMKRIAAADAAKPGMKIVPADDDPLTDTVAMRLFRYLIPTAVAAGLAIIVTHWVMTQKVNELRQQASSLQQQNERSAMQILDQSQRLELLKSSNQSQTQVVDMLRSADLKLVHLDPGKSQPNAVANLLWDRKLRQWAILIDRMTPPPTGQTYELWIVPTGGAPVAAGTFNVDSSGRGAIQVAIPAGIEASVAAVTNEPIGGVAKPTGSFQLLKNLN